MGLARAARALAGGRAVGTEILAGGYGGLHSGLMRHRHERMPKANVSLRRNICDIGFSAKRPSALGRASICSQSRYRLFLQRRPRAAVIAEKR